MCNGILDEGSFGLLAKSSSSQLIQLWTQRIDDHTHNVLMILMNDIREEIGVDAVNLTGSMKTRICLCFFGIDF